MELQELSGAGGAGEPPRVMLPSTLIGQGLVIPARPPSASQLHCLEQQEQVGTTGHHHTCPAPRHASAPSASRCLLSYKAASSNYLACRAYGEISSSWDNFQYNKQERHYLKKTREMQEISKNCKNSPGQRGQ